MIRAVGVVVPAHNEQDDIAHCIDSLRSAIARLPRSVECQVALVLDACTDDTSRMVDPIKNDLRFRTTIVNEHNVGSARYRGAADVLSRLVRYSDDDIWIATTDADSTVGSEWLTKQLELADSGADAVAGTVKVSDWGTYDRVRAQNYNRFYAGIGGSSHSHVHGANMGIRASVYNAVGGFPRLASGEDHAIWNAVKAREFKTIATRELVVTTSSRLVGRAPAGFARFLREFPAGA